MKGIERVIVIISGLFLAGLFGLIAYLRFGLDQPLPGCLTAEKGFDKGSIIQRSENVYEVHVVAKMWAFEPSEIKVKPNTTLEIYLASVDVTHGFHIENTNVNLMAVPGAVNYAKVTLKEPGVYHVVCHEYCGAGHQNMTAKIIVGDEMDFPIVLTAHKPMPNDPVSLGRGLFQTKGCVVCHSTDGNVGVGPSFKKLWGRKEALADGSVVTVDEEYVTESIKSPTAKIVKGFQPSMPMLSVTDDELKQLLSYLKTL